MSLDAKLLNVGLVLIVLVPIAALFFRRWWKGELGFYGFWASPSEIKARDKAARDDTGAGPGARP